MATSGGRFTRSRLAPDWSLQDLLTLACEVAAVEEDCRGAISAHQRWEIVADHCAALGVPRSAAHCRRRWDALSSDCRAIAHWEASRGPSEGSYWCAEPKRRKELGLPDEFDRELFGLVCGALAVKEGLILKDAVGGDREEADEDGINDKDEEVMLSPTGNKKSKGQDIKEDKYILLSAKTPEMVKPKENEKGSHVSCQMEEPALQNKDEINTSNYKNKHEMLLRHHDETNGGNLVVSDRMQDMVLHMQVSAEQMEAVLRGTTQTGEGTSCYLPDLKEQSSTEIESARLQADQLIAAVEVLCERIGQWCNIVRQELATSTGT